MKGKLILKKVFGVLALLIAIPVLCFILYRLFKGTAPFTPKLVFSLSAQSLILFQGLRWLREK